MDFGKDSDNLSMEVGTGRDVLKIWILCSLVIICF